MAHNKNRAHAILGMFKVLEIRGPMAKLADWDANYKEINNVYVADVIEPSFAVGGLHMMELVLRGGLLKVEFCSPAYEEGEYFADYWDEDEESSADHLN